MDQTRIQILVSKTENALPCYEHTLLLEPVFKIKMEFSELTTSVGQPTTLVIGLPDIQRPSITWKKEGKPVDHPVLPDGSLYIANTILSDQGRYIVTVTSSDGTSESATLHLTVIDPHFPTGKIVLTYNATCKLLYCCLNYRFFEAQAYQSG